MRAVLSGLLWVFLASQSAAGAWPREEGQVFVSSAANLWISDGTQAEIYYDPTFYAEYGLPDRMTVGLNYFGSKQDTENTGSVFLRLPLDDGQGPHRFASSFGVGLMKAEQTPFAYLTEASLSWGRGLPSGWLTVDAQGIYDLSASTFRPKLDATWGYNLSSDWTTMLQLQSGATFEKEPYAKLSPAIIYRVSDSVRVSLATVSPLSGEEAHTIRLAIWQNY